VVIGLFVLAGSVLCASNGPHAALFIFTLSRCGLGVCSWFLCWLPVPWYSCGTYEAFHPAIPDGLLEDIEVMHVFPHTVIHHNDRGGSYGFAVLLDAVNAVSKGRIHTPLRPSQTFWLP